jgi:hypothetical protein
MLMDIAFAKPADYFLIPAKQRQRRCTLTSDLCVIDERRFYLRGILYVPVNGAKKRFGWGLWARVSKRTFHRYLELYYADGTEEPPFRGHLSVEDKPGYEGLNGNVVRIQFRTASDRPQFTLGRSKNRLYREQQQGITLHRVHEIVSPLLASASPTPAT